MLEEPFAHGGSVVHRIDPRCRVAYGTVFAFVVALSQDFRVLAAALALGVSAAALARLAPGPLARRLLAVNVFVLFLWALVPLTAGGEALWAWGPVSVSRAGVLLCARITLRANAVVLTAFAMFATMPVARLGHSLSRLGVPEKFVHLLLLCHRYVFVLGREYTQMRRAAALRNFTPRPDVHTWRTYAWLVGMLLVRATARADRVHQAMLCRGFTGTFHTLDALAFRRADAAWALAFGACAAALVWAEWLV